MPENDIYNSKEGYEKFISNFDSLLNPPIGEYKIGKRKYYCKNPVNLNYFKALTKIFDQKDNSYIRRLRLFRTLLIIVYTTDKDLGKCEREDINDIVAFSHTVNKSIKTKEDFVKDIKYLWKTLFPEKDERGRIDETLTPYAVRHLTRKIEKSQQKLRNDRLNIEEFENIVSFFDNDPEMQFYLTLSFESLGRPQEILYTRIGDLEINDSYAKIYISSHGKEGTKFLQCIDSYPYLIKWYEKHPFKSDKSAFLFFCKTKDRQMTPCNMNKKIKLALNKLGIDKRITPYSIKRNGVTFARLRGDSDVDIQHRAGWTSTKQIRTYDMSNAEDSYKKELAKRGLIKESEYEKFSPKTKQCLCGNTVGFSDRICPKCKRLLDQTIIKAGFESEDIMSKILAKLAEKNKTLIFETIEELKLKDSIERL